ncbi:hypothetical protein D3C80_1587070 [compost metagenome]
MLGWFADVGFVDHGLPTSYLDLLAAGQQLIGLAAQMHLGFQVFVVGQELRQVAGADQGVYGALPLGQLIQRDHRGSGDDAVVGGDLAAVPGAGPPCRIEFLEALAKRRVGCGQGL